MPAVYMDNNATTRVDPAVLEEMLPYFSDLYGNPSSMHTFGGQVGRKISQARERVAEAFNCNPDEVMFNACGTEGDNTAIRSALASQPEKRHIITTRVEHPAVLNVAKHLERRGYEATYLGVDAEGRLDLDELRDSIRHDTALVSVMYANNETGVIFPIQEIAEIAKERGVLVHTDAVQVLGKVPFDLKTLPVDFLAVSGHKVHAPKGVGALFVRKGVQFRPFMLGGHQERGRRAGTENAASIVGLGVAAERALAFMEHENTEVARLRDKLEAGILAAVPYAFVTGDPGNRLPNTANIAFEYIEGEAILLLLNKVGIAASSGSACTSGSLEPSHVMRAMDIPYTAAHGTVRFSLSRYTTEEEIDRVIREVPPIVAQLRKLSPYWSGNGPVEDPGKAFAPVYG